MTRQQVGRGCLLGALVGDAAGATLEFLGRAPERSEGQQSGRRAATPQRLWRGRSHAA